MAEVIIKKGEGRSFKAGGLWIYDNEIDRGLIRLTLPHAGSFSVRRTDFRVL